MKKPWRKLLPLLAALLLAGCVTPRWGWPPWEPTPDPPIVNPSLDLPEGTEWIFGWDINHWPQTITLTHAQLVYRGINSKGDPAWRVYGLDYDRLHEIPAYYMPGDPDNVHNVNGSIWLVREFRGQWYVGTIDYLRKGQREKEFAINDAFKLDPKSGDRMGFMVSTMNRSYDGTQVQGDPNSPYKERSNVVWTVWP